MRILFRLSALATIALGLVMVIWSFPIIEDGAGGLVAPELRLTGYTADEARAFFAALSDPARAHYLGTQHLLDLIYPALLALTFLLAIFRYGARLSILWRGLLALVPLAATAADYAENALMAQMLAQPADQIDAAMIAQASLLTQIKFGAVLATLAIVIVLAISFAIGRRRRMRRRAAKQGRS